MTTVDELDSVIRAEDPSQPERRTHHLEDLGRDVSAIEHHRRTFVRQRHRRHAVGRHVGQRARLRAERRELRSVEPGGDACCGVGWRADPPIRCTMCTRRSGLLVHGSGLTRTALTTLKIAVFAPMPSARVAIAMTANTGAARIWRIAYCTSVRASSIHGMACRYRLCRGASITVYSRRHREHLTWRVSSPEVRQSETRRHPCADRDAVTIRAPSAPLIPIARS